MRVLESGGLGRLAPFGMHVLMPCRRWQEGTDELVQNTWGSEKREGWIHLVASF